MSTRASLPTHEIRMMELGALAEARAPFNPRTISKAARERLKSSLERFGVAASLTFNARTGRLVGGHQRVAVLADELPPETPVPVIVVDVSPEEERALNLQLNRLDLMGNFDADALAALVRELPEATREQLDFDALPGWAGVETPSELLDKILSEPEWQPDSVTPEDREALAQRLADWVRQLPLHELSRALLVALPHPWHRGNRDNILVLSDPSAADLADELRRLHEAGIASPLDSLAERLWK